VAAVRIYALIFSFAPELQIRMDKAAAAAYGWSDIELGHKCYETSRGIRYGISDEARDEVLDRLVKLNQERHANEGTEQSRLNGLIRARTKALPGAVTQSRPIQPDLDLGFRLT
jgi:hypothetical protein